MEGVTWMQGVIWKESVTWKEGITRKKGVIRKETEGVTWMEGITWTEGVTWKEGVTWTKGVTCMYVCMYLFKRQLESRRYLERAHHLDGGRRLETGRRASSLVRSRDIAFGSGQGVHALSIPHLRYLRHGSYAPGKSRRVKIQTALERSRRTLQDTIMLTLFFDLWRHRKVKKVKMYWFIVVNSLSRKTNLPNKMELNKHKYHRNDLGVASWAYFEDLWRHKRGQYWPIRGQLGEFHELAVGLWKFKQRSRGIT